MATGNNVNVREQHGGGNVSSGGVSRGFLEARQNQTDEGGVIKEAARRYSEQHGDEGGYAQEEGGSTAPAAQPVDRSQERRKKAAEKIAQDALKEQAARREVPKAPPAPTSTEPQAPRKNPTPEDNDQINAKESDNQPSKSSSSQPDRRSKQNVDDDANELSEESPIESPSQTGDTSSNKKAPKKQEQDEEAEDSKRPAVKLKDRAAKRAKDFVKNNPARAIVDEIVGRPASSRPPVPMREENENYLFDENEPEQLSIEDQKAIINETLAPRVLEEMVNDSINNVIHDYTASRMNNPLADNVIPPRNGMIDISSRALKEIRESEHRELSGEYERRIDKEGLRDSPDESAVDITNRDKQKRQNNVFKSTIQSFVVGLFPIEGMTNEGVLPDAIDERVTLILKEVNKPNTMMNLVNIFRSVMLYASLSVDRHGKIFNKDAKEFSLTVDEVCKIMDLMLASCRENKTPFGIVGNGSNLRGTKMFPCGVVPKEVAKFWTGEGSNLNQTAAELVQRTADVWNTEIYPALKANLEDQGQRVVIEDFVRAISMVDGIDPNRFTERYGVRSEMDHMLNELMDINSEYRAVMADIPGAEEVAAEHEAKIKMYRMYFDKRRGLVKAKTENGWEYVNFNKEGGFIQALRLYTKCARTAGILFNVPVIMSAFFEHGLGNLRTKIVIATLNAAFDTNYKDISEFTMQTMRSPEAIEAFQCVKELYDAFGPGACRLFAETGMQYTKENVSKFANENLRKAHADGKFPELMGKFDQKLNQLTHSIMVGDAAFRKSDLKLWFNAYLTTNAIMKHSSESGGNVETPLTPQEIESAIRATDIGTFFSQVMGTDAGINAYNMMRANNIGQVSPLSYMVSEQLHAHPAIETLTTMFVDTYPRYGINFIYMLTPFSRTMTYVNQQLIRPARTQEGEYEGKYSDMYIGGNMGDFTTGLIMNIVYDMATFGHNFIIGGIIGLALAALGFDEPEDERWIDDVESWRIGKNLGWGENGEGIEISMAWWINDLTQLQLPVAYFTAAIQSGQDPDRARRLMESSLGKTIDGNVLFDFVNTMATWRKDLVAFDEMSKDPEFSGPKDMMTYMANGAFWQMMKAVGKVDPLNVPYRNLMHNSWLRGEDAREPDYWKVFKRGNEWNEKHGITKPVGSYDEYLRRKFAASNLLFAAGMDLSQMIAGNPKTDTGYFWWQMPARSQLDPLEMSVYNAYKIDLDKIPDDFRPDLEDKTERSDAYIAFKTDQILALIDSYGVEHYEQAISDGLCLDKETRNYVLAELKNRKSFLLADWFAKSGSGEYNDAKSEYYEFRDKMTDYKKYWLTNNDIPTYPTKYEQVISNNRVRYVRKSTGESVPDLYAVLNPFDVDMIYEPKGDHPNNILPLTIVDTGNTGWNAETKTVWNNGGSIEPNLDAIRNGAGRNIIASGKDAGKTVNDVLFHDRGNETFAHPDDPTIGHRSHVAQEFTDDLDDEFYNNAWDDSKYNASTVYGDAGKYNQQLVDAISGKGGSGSGGGGGYGRLSYASPYPRSSYGVGTSAGSGNYNPKIYSNPRQLNAPKAASMYTKQPYNTQTNYLRPSFATKGSREAYRRQDF